MRKTKKVGALILSLLLCFTFNMNVFAKEVDTLTPYPPIESNIMTRGAKPPTSRADIHDLSVSSYNYQVTDMGYRVYTSKWVTGVSEIHITVNNWELLESYYGATNDKLTLRVYNSSKEQVDSKSITISSGSGYAKISGLSSSAKYYVCFEVPTNGNRYSFDGSIY